MAYEPVGFSIADIGSAISKIPSGVSTGIEYAAKALQAGKAAAPTTGLMSARLIAMNPGTSFQAMQVAPKSSGLPSWTKYALYAGLAVGAIFVIKKMRKGK